MRANSAADLFLRACTVCRSFRVDVARRLLNRWQMRECLFVVQLHKLSILAHPSSWLEFELNHRSSDFAFQFSHHLQLRLVCRRSRKTSLGHVAISPQLDFSIMHTLDCLINCLVRNRQNPLIISRGSALAWATQCSTLDSMNLQRTLHMCLLSRLFAN